MEELARALTGWRNDPEPNTRPARNGANWGKPMVPSTWQPERDSGAKTVMGRSFAAGRSATQDLDDIVAMLMDHPNIAPFVSFRLIQQLVKSDPSPDYVARVAARFRDNGSGVAGDLAAVAKAILLDPEARRGDNPALASPGDGKFREPWLHRLGTFRGMGCRANPVRSDGRDWVLGNQAPLGADSVFGFYAPADRVAGSNLLAPEQRLVNSQELTTRFGELHSMRWDPVLGVNNLSQFIRGQCDIDEFVRAFAASPTSFVDLLATRYFRGAMPFTLRRTVERLIRKPHWNADDHVAGTLYMLSYALASPAYGVIK